MSMDRRTFLGVAGISALVIAGKSSLEALTKGGQAEDAAAGRPATRWAMAVDLHKCGGAQACTDCIAACDRAHNVPHFAERKHEVKWIWTEPYDRTFPDQGNQYTNDALKEKPVLVLCNHCDNPPCVRVCPVRATWKREDGIVMMDYHRCIGCRYCMAACPYGARSFNWLDARPRIKEVNPEYPMRAIGVVEKCNFCEERLAKGKQPACVEACPEKALVLGNLNDPESKIRELLRTRYAIRRRPELGTDPNVYYIV